jgi:hypothetical protein
MKASILRKDDVQALTGQGGGQDLTSRQSETLTGGGQHAGNMYLYRGTLLAIV